MLAHDFKTSWLNPCIRLERGTEANSRQSAGDGSARPASGEPSSEGAAGRHAPAPCQNREPVGKDGLGLLTGNARSPLKSL